MDELNLHKEPVTGIVWAPDNPTQLCSVSEDNSVITLKDTGLFNVGRITLDGPNSRIYGDSFSITPELASFSNIAASGKISTVVFEQGHTQSVGGIMMFKPSYKIESYADNAVTLDQNFGGAVGDYIYIVKEDGTTISGITVSAINNKVVTLSNSVSGNLISLIDIGKADDLIIGVNSSDASSSFLRPRGITISEFKTDGTSPNPKVFLGDLDSSGIDFSDTGAQKDRGFGLYSENVYLTGSLTTKVNNNSFAGVNTLDGANAIKLPDDDSKIVFWAGSEGVATSQIQNAPFQVTENGSIYASQGVFTGAILTDTYISGADIYAARIHGTGPQGNGLSFYDTANGIVFFRGEQNNNPTEVFSLGTNGLKKSNDYFIEVGNTIDFKGNNYRTKVTQGSPYVRIYDNYITGARVDSESVETVDTKVTFNQQEIKFSVGSSENMSIAQSLIKMSSNEVQMDNTVLFGENLKYKKVSGGYDLYVLS